MCRNVKTQSICPTCNERISETTDQQWCRDARRKGRFGRCAMGIRRRDDEFRGDECRRCAEVREIQMGELEMSDFAAKGLGWRTTTSSSKGKGAASRGELTSQVVDDSDDGMSYTW